MNSVDIIVVGGGMVGLSAALSAANNGYQVAVADAAPAPQKASDAISNRVSAINLNSQHWLTQLGAWQGIEAQRATPFQWMHVWQSDQPGEVTLKGSDLAGQTGASELGHIVENNVVASALHQQAQAHANIQLFQHVQCQQLNLGEREAWLTLEDGTMLGAQLVVAADGANSWCRQQASLPITFRDYGHHAIVATVKTQRPHEHCARQAFTEHGPLAFLPLHQPDLCSIVWSVPPEVATEISALDNPAFAKKLTAAFDATLGVCELVSQPTVIPLTMRYARQWLKPRLVLMGDAAHTIHPLAGQGVNLGFGDAQAWAEQLQALANRSNQDEVLDLGDVNHWRGYERARKAAAMEMIAGMDAIKFTFSAHPAPLKTLIGLGMNLVDKAPVIKTQLIKKAMGLV
ncbi:FAD-dependent oxidoreductase [Echinimonas agarilytica]|uniref:FAD-dependent oxidoreductase n=1 Tax=Echinimonas agarilytica TaxID=1215918 RepID=A0AA42B6K8_9GAMM|nr:FAD-dependent oxidoreductase [Echinimonas agarilytica]